MNGHTLHHQQEETQRIEGANVRKGEGGGKDSWQCSCGYWNSYLHSSCHSCLDSKPPVAQAEKDAGHTCGNCATEPCDWGPGLCHHWTPKQPAPVVHASCEKDISVIFPAQCSCGHIFLERYMLSKPNTNGEVGFCRSEEH